METTTSINNSRREFLETEFPIGSGVFLYYPPVEETREHNNLEYEPHFQRHNDPHYGQISGYTTEGLIVVERSGRPTLTVKTTDLFILEDDMRVWDELTLGDGPGWSFWLALATLSFSIAFIVWLSFFHG